MPTGVILFDGGRAVAGADVIFFQPSKKGDSAAEPSQSPSRQFPLGTAASTALEQPRQAVQQLQNAPGIAGLHHRWSHASTPISHSSLVRPYAEIVLPQQMPFDNAAMTPSEAYGRLGYIVESVGRADDYSRKGYRMEGVGSADRFSELGYQIYGGQFGFCSQKAEAAYLQGPQAYVNEQDTGGSASHWACRLADCILLPITMPAAMLGHVKGMSII